MILTSICAPSWHRSLNWVVIKYADDTQQCLLFNSCLDSAQVELGKVLEAVAWYLKKSQLKLSLANMQVLSLGNRGTGLGIQLSALKDRLFAPIEKVRSS